MAGVVISNSDCTTPNDPLDEILTQEGGNSGQISGQVRFLLEWDLIWFA